MLGMTRRQVLTTASGAGAATMLGGAMFASAVPLGARPGPAVQSTPQQLAKAGADDPMNMYLLDRVRQ